MIFATRIATIIDLTVYMIQKRENPYSLFAHLAREHNNWGQNYHQLWPITVKGALNPRFIMEEQIRSSSPAKGNCCRQQGQRDPTGFAIPFFSEITLGEVIPSLLLFFFVSHNIVSYLASSSTHNPDALPTPLQHRLQHTQSTNHQSSRSDSYRCLQNARIDS